MFADCQGAGPERGKYEQDVIFFFTLFALFKIRIREHRDGNSRD